MAGNRDESALHLQTLNRRIAAQAIDEATFTHRFCYSSKIASPLLSHRLPDIGLANRHRDVSGWLRRIYKVVQHHHEGEGDRNAILDTSKALL